MPLKPLMTWNEKMKRWFKKYNKAQYSVSCLALKVPANERDSMRAANSWWIAKQLEIDQAEQAEKRPFADKVNDAWKNVMGKKKEEKKPAVTIESMVNHFLDRQHKKIGTKIKAQRFIHLKKYMADILDFCDEKGIEVISEEFLSSYFYHIAAKVKARKQWDGEGEKVGLEPESAHSKFAVAKMFCKYLYQNRLIELPLRNIDDSDLQIEMPAKQVKTADEEMVHQLLNSAKPRLKLFLLLMLNCGMYQGDISDLDVTEIDWKNGRIKRKRSKEKDTESVPVVDYLLWKPTFDLLLEHKPDYDKGPVFLTRFGVKMVAKEMRQDGTYTNRDGIGKLYAHLVKEIPNAPQLKMLRKTSASLLHNNPHYSAYVDLFLGHAPSGINARNYLNVTKLDEALLWLGSELGIQ